MKKIYYGILTLASFVVFLAIGFFTLNDAINVVDVTQIQGLKIFIMQYCPLILLGLFAFTHVVTKWVKVIIVLILVLIVITGGITIFSPDWITNAVTLFKL